MTTHENILSEIFHEYEFENEYNSEALELESILGRLMALYQKVPAPVKSKISKGITIGSIISKLVSPEDVMTNPNLPEKTYADHQRVEQRKRKDQIENSPRSKQNISSKEFEGTILGEILGISSHENELHEYESLMAEMQEFYENNFQNTNRNSILAEIMLEEEVGTSRNQWRLRAAKIIASKGDKHPLWFLIKEKGRFKSPRLTMKDLEEDPKIVEMGHIVSNNSRGNKKEQIMIQMAYLNQLRKKQDTFEAVDIEGVATDLESAKRWVDLKLLDKKWLSSPLNFSKYVNN
jgi:Bacterial toxin 5